MVSDRPDRTDDDDAADGPTTAEVVRRLENLWARQRPAAPPPLPSPVGHRVGKYVIRRVIGRGAFGIVYQAHDDQLQRDVALKLPRPEVVLDREKLVRFEREATTAAALDHPSILPVYEADLCGPTPFIASAYCTGPDLRRWLSGRESPVPSEQAAAFVAQLADAVQYAHDHGVLHRDLKPGNILLEPSGADPVGEELADFSPRLTDFGLAKLVEDNIFDTRSSLLVGTPLYMAPEQLSSDSADTTAATDVYALGVLLFELLTLRTPFEGKSYVDVLDRLRSQPPRSPRDISPNVPRDLETICQKCLAKDIEDRYQSACEVHEELDRYSNGQPVRARPVTWWDRLARWRRQPERIASAGRFSLYYQLLIIVWCLGNYFAGEVFAIFSADILRRSIVDIAFVSVTMHLPKAWLGYMVLSGRRWAFWPAAITSAVLLGIFLESAFGWTSMFEYNYPTPHSRLSVHMGLILCSLIETSLYVLAVPAWHRASRSSRIES